jgi:hypothetical protein
MRQGISTFFLVSNVVGFVRMLVHSGSSFSSGLSTDVSALFPFWLACQLEPVIFQVCGKFAISVGYDSHLAATLVSQ